MSEQSPRLIETEPPPKFSSVREARAWQQQLERKRQENR